MKKILFLTLIVSLKAMACGGGSLRLNDDSTLLPDKIRFDLDPESSILIENLITEKNFMSEGFQITDSKNSPTHIVKFIGYVRGAESSKDEHGNYISIGGKGKIISTTYSVSKIGDANQNGIVQITSNEAENGMVARGLGKSEERNDSYFDKHDFKSNPLLKIGCN